ncbi:MAG TPA: cation-transporting P-type ATPase, partial [Patescibacteria group bacterium]|nr:cation-transporting P-type ATPase [Patescibacteria group bacterium]
AVFIGLVVMIAGQYFRMSMYHNFLFALALSVSVVPEGLPAAISVALSIGMKRLLKDNVLAKKLNAVETLGSVSVICTDKTGTITKNELTVVKIVLAEKEINVSGVGYNPTGNFFENEKEIINGKNSHLAMALKIGYLCNEASLVRDKDGRWKIIGDPTEGALIVVARKYGEQKLMISGETKISEIPFSSERMKMSVVYAKGNDQVSYVKGSPDILIDSCVFINDYDGVRPFAPGEKDKIRQKYNEMSETAQRVLAFAYKKLEISKKKSKKINDPECELIWAGMMGMIDPPRDDVNQAISECKNLGINPIMITGDYALTAHAIAKNVGLIDSKIENKEKNIIDGKALIDLNDQEIYSRIKSGACVFARITPEQKLRIATALKNNGEIIAMTGDGVNDAPALKKADIGVAMGIMGTDVAKDASDMILLDDNFSSIVKGIEEGRTIFQNLKKFVHYVLTSNASELITVLFGVILHIPSPISAVQILAIDLGTDIFPSFALGVEPPEPRIGSRKNKNINSMQNIMTVAGFRRLLYLGIIMATGAVVAFIWSMWRGGWHFGTKFPEGSVLYIKSTAAAYAVLSMSQMANLLQSRSETLSPVVLGFWKNRWAIISIFISLAILLGFMYIPICQQYLGMLPIDRYDWLMVVITFLAVFGWEEIRKTEDKEL